MRLALALFAAGLASTACKAADPPGAALPAVEIADARYKGLVFLVATVRREGADFAITNDSTQPWFDVTLVLAGSGDGDYQLRLSEVDAGQTVHAASAQFATPAGLAFDARRVMPHTLIVSAEIGGGGPTGVYAAGL